MTPGNFKVNLRGKDFSTFANEKDAIINNARLARGLITRHYLHPYHLWKIYIRERKLIFDLCPFNTKRKKGIHQHKPVLLATGLLTTEEEFDCARELIKQYTNLRKIGLISMNKIIDDMIYTLDYNVERSRSI